MNLLDRFLGHDAWTTRQLLGAHMAQYRITIALLLLTAVAHADDTPQPEAVQAPELRLELLERAKADQDARRAVTKWMRQFRDKNVTDQTAFEASLDAAQKAEFQKFAEKMRRIDAENTERMRQIVEKHGWPTYALVGKDAAKAAWILVQHADASPKFQRRCLDLMAKAPRDQVLQADVAYLTDRVLLAEGKKQRYGTQFVLENGKFTPRPLEDEAAVDRRRAEVGLPPLAEYAKQVEEFYGRGPKK